MRSLVSSLFALTLLLSACGGPLARPPVVPVNPLPSLAPPPSPMPLPGPGPDPFPLPGPIDKRSIEHTYAPVLYLDSRERSPLTSVDAHMRMGVDLKGDFDKRNIMVEAKVPLDNLNKYPQRVLERFGQGYNLHLDAGRQIAIFDNTVYIHKVEIGAFTYIQYWFFYSYNDTTLLGGPPGGIVQRCGNHEADWEHISLRINTRLYQQASSEAELLRAIDDIYLSQHTRFQHFERKWFRPTQAPIAFDGTHIRIYPSNGSHASYPAPGEVLMLNLGGFRVKDITDGKGRRIPTHEGNLVPLAEQPWAQFGGRWGAISHDVCNVVEFFSPASNDGPYGPMKNDSPQYFYQTDWQGVNRPPITPVDAYAVP
jgi:hypothetical protein